MDNNEFNYSSSNDFKQIPKKGNSGFGKNVFLPFVSGIVGAALILGICLGVPSIKEKIFDITSSSTTISESQRIW